MTLRLRSLFLILSGILFLWFLYVERAILTPFVLAAIFAYIFNPVVNFFHNKLKFPRTLSVILIYLVIISVIIFSGITLSKRAVGESTQLRNEATQITKTAKNQINTLPDFIRPTVSDILSSFDKYTTISYPSALALFPKAFSRILGFIIFLFSAFYFLKEGRKMFDKLLHFVPNDYKVEVDILMRKINSILGSYLRGQVFLVFFVSLTLFIALSILGVKYALLIAIFSGFAEIVPIIGPIVAAAVAAIIAFTGGNSNFNLEPFQLAIVIIIIYFVVRQIQDYLINPYIMGKITKLHPLLILFSVIAGEHTAGVLGLILAVPIAGVLRILFEYGLDKINNSENDELSLP